jgi:hypothetical protein
MQNLAATKAAILSVAGQRSANPTESYVDTLGFDSALVLISLGATGASGISALKLQESDASGSGYTDIVDLTAIPPTPTSKAARLLFLVLATMTKCGSSTSISVVASGTCKCVVDSATNASVLGVTAVLGRAGESIATNAGHTSSTVGGAGVFRRDLTLSPF